MAVEKRFANRNWVVADDTGDIYNVTREGVVLAVLMDIRDELQRLNALLHCTNFRQIPRTLSNIDRRLATPRKRTRRKKP